MHVAVLHSHPVFLSLLFMGGGGGGEGSNHKNPVLELSKDKIFSV